MESQDVQTLIEAINSLSQPTLFDWLNFLLSIIAIIYAIRIPEKIARIQNRIALHEERYKITSAVEKIKEISSILSLKSENELCLKSEEIQDFLNKTIAPYEVIFTALEKTDYLFSEATSYKILTIKVRFFYIITILNELPKISSNEIKLEKTKEMKEHITFIEEKLKNESLNDEFYKELNLK